MDRLDAFVALANLKLRIEVLQRNPSLIPNLKESDMASVPSLPAPIQLAGLKSRLQRAKGLEARAGAAGTRVDAALDIIETGVSALENHAPQLEKYGDDLMSTINGLLESSNGGPPLDDVPAIPTSPAAPVAAAETNSVPGPNGGPRFPNQS